MKLSPSIVVQKLGKEFVAYDTETSTMHELNETAFFVLTRIQKKKILGEIIKDLAKEYAIETRRAKDDVEELVRELTIKKIIES